VRVLAKLGANVETPDNYADTPLFTAAWEGHTEVVRVLAELGVPLDSKVHGRTPLFVAAHNGRAETVPALVELGADVAMPSQRFGVSVPYVTVPWTPLKASVARCKLDVAKTLLLLGASVTEYDLWQEPGASGSAPRLRHELNEWAIATVDQHRVFVRTFLFGCTVPADAGADGADGADANPVLPLIGGIRDVKELVASFVGVVMGEELRHARAICPAIDAIDWSAEDTTRGTGDPWAA